MISRMAAKYPEDMPDGDGYPEQDEIQRFLNSLKLYRETYRKLNHEKGFRTILRIPPHDIVEVQFLNNIDTFHLEQLQLYQQNDPSLVPDAIRLLSIEARHITELTFYEENYSNPLMFPRELIHIFQSLKTLVTLKINKYKFVVDDLIEIGWSLIRLKNLDIAISPLRRTTTKNQTSLNIFKENYDERFKWKFIMSFRNLETFLFSVVTNVEGDSKLQHELTEFCVKHLPKLKQVGDSTFFTDMTEACKDQGSLSKLENLSVLLNRCVKLDNSYFKSFPNVKKLTIKWEKNGCPPVSEYNFTPLLEFLVLESLEFLNLNSLATLEIFLHSYERSLKRLKVEVDPETENQTRHIRFATILGFCPKLQELTVSNISNPINDSVWPFLRFRHLEVLHLNINRSGNGRAVSLSNILEAPSLRKVFLSGIYQRSLNSISFEQPRSAVASKILNVRVVSRFEFLLQD
ncbi:Hypothetical predicted protein [Cloeon dipterum]|uniref:Uncharacterized protein n=1 Tax=Cloeon dipterum TaxID=197152 RepID=A0A8S1EAE9_9INSE|nr:Hypothetical predicted protein [Cloeon dipterum]